MTLRTIDYAAGAIFPLLAAIAYKLILVNAEEAQIGPKISELCTPGSAFALNYTGIEAVDTFLCKFVVIFDSILQPPTSLPFIIYFLCAALPIIPVMFHIEAVRTGSRFPLSYPTVFSMMYQTVTFGVTMNVYAMFSVLTGSATYRPQVSISQGHMEAIVFGVLIACFIPTAGMFILREKYIIALWQVFPILQYIAQQAHLFVRPPSRHSSSGFTIIQVTYLVSFCFMSSCHLATILPRWGKWEELTTMFVPSISALASTSSFDHIVLNLLQWDMIMGILAMVLYTFWFARSAKQLVTIILWYCLAGPFFGPGASVTAVLLWRESMLEATVPKKKS